jgi:general secretion pathway protein A
MYKNFFGLRENPFNVNPDPRFLYLTPQTQEARDQLIYGIQNRKGFILLTGEVGTGKTTLVNYLLDWLHQQKIPTAFVFNSHLSVNHLFDFILTDFGIPIDFPLKSNMLLLLNQWLIERFRAGGTPVLIVDEAQGLSFELLEEIRLLLNLETASEKLLQIVLVGQPELEEKLKRPELRQLRQRITLRCNTAPLTLEESHGYIAGRLRIAGATGASVFATEAVEAVHFYSRGIPRVINLLCEHSLINAYVEELNPVPAQMVEEAARDFLMDEFRAVSTRSSVSPNMDGKLTVMPAIFARDLVRPSTREETGSHEARGAKWPAALEAFTDKESVLTAENIPVKTVPECDVNAAAEKSLNVPLSLDDLGPASPVLEPGQDERTFSLDSISSQSDSAAELVAAMKRMLTAASPIPPPHLMASRGRSEPSSAAKSNRISASEICALTLDTMNRIPGKSHHTQLRALLPSLEWWRAVRETVFLRAIPRTAWSRVSAAVIRWIEEPFYPARALHRWKVEFKRDWISMINAAAFPLMKKSSLRWLRQPISSKPLASSKN